MAAHSEISPTSKLVAQYRQYSDLPYVKEVAANLKPDVGLKALIKGLDFFTDMKLFFAPYLEARYRGMTSAIRRTGIKQVLELASGVSLRGLAMASEDPTFTYVETDLPGILTEKLAIVDKITKDTPDNWFNVPANALVLEDLQRALKLFPANSKVVFANEGLMQYLSLSEKETLAKHIHGILSERGGAWVTSDLDTKEQKNMDVVGKDRLKKFGKVFTKVTKRDLDKSAFENDKHRDEFFDRLGFRIEFVPMIKGPEEVTALKNLNVPQALYSRFPSLNITVLHLK